MDRIINISLTALILIVSSCYSVYKVPIHTQGISGVDTVNIKRSSIPLERHKVLLVYISDTTATWETSMLGTDSTYTRTFYGRESNFNSGFYNHVFKGKVDNHFYNLTVSLKAAEELRDIAHVKEIKSPTAYSPEQIDSLGRTYGADVVIMNKSIDFKVNQEDLFSSMFISSSQAFGWWYSTSISIGGGSYISVVDYKADWKMYWIDYEADTGFREQTIAQQGGFWNPKERSPETDVMSCALKAGEDFANLFKGK